ncbi:uncharacterized protein LOC143051338 [Mytilus galloprovincialis]|uniref:uncharacterized protein LOC143051338 n=1 Tax=Mytilus galloprovincialis TaxID=29158 RepID=UPI003F7B4FD7
MTCVIKMYKIVLLIAVVCLIFAELNGYSNVYNESKCATAGKNETGRLHCKEHDHIHIEKIWTDEDKCIFGKSANISYTIRNVSCISNSSCDVKYETNISSKYLNIVYKCADCVPLKYNTTSEIACRNNTIIEIYDVWITNEQEHCPSYKQTHKIHTFNNYHSTKSAFSKKCNWKSSCEIYNSDQHRKASYIYSVYYQCKAENKSLELENDISRQGGVIAGVVIGILVILCILVAVFVFRRRIIHKNKTDISDTTYGHKKVPKECQNGTQNSSISNSMYTELFSSIEYTYAILSAEPDSFAQHGNQNNRISNSTYIELDNLGEYSYATPSEEPDISAEQNNISNVHQNGNHNNSISNSTYIELDHSGEYSYATPSEEPDISVEQNKISEVHQNGNHNNSISNSTYIELDHSGEYSYATPSEEPDISAEQNNISEVHQNGNHNNSISNSTYIELDHSGEYSYATPSEEPDISVEQNKISEVHQNGNHNSDISISPYEMASSIEYAYAMRIAEPQ